MSAPKTFNDLPLATCPLSIEERAVGQAVRYLAARGLLEPHPSNTRLVRILMEL